MKKTLLSLSLIAMALVGKAQTPCSELFFSEQVEGSGNNKAMEIFNPTSSSINMTNYRFVRYSNGSLSSTDSTDLTGTIGAFGTYVIVNGQTVSTGTTSPACDPVLQAYVTGTNSAMGILDHAYPAPTYANGDDALVLVKISPYKIIDIFGKIGEDPGSCWTDVIPYTSGSGGAYWTSDHSLRRKPSVDQGITSNPSLFNVTTQWDSLPKNTYSGLNTHSCVCTVGIKENEFSKELSVFPNPLVGEELTVLSTTTFIKHINVSNTLGQVVYSQDVVSSEKSIKLKKTNYTSGVYFIQIIGANNEIAIKKIIIN